MMADELTRAIFQAQRTLLDHHPLYLQISKNEFAALLLKELGPGKISPSVINDIFNEVNDDNDGWISVDELAAFMIKAKRRGLKDMYDFYYERLVHASYIGSAAFLSASTLSITKNIFIRFYIGWHLFASVAAKLVPWLLTIGSFIFVWSALNSAMLQLHDPQSHFSLAAKVKLITTKQVINTFWVFGSLAYIIELWLIGGVCYFIGGSLGFPFLYNSVLADLLQHCQLMSKLHTTLTECEGFDEERGNLFLSRGLGSCVSDLSDPAGEKEEGHGSSFDRRLKRSLSDSSLAFKDRNVQYQTSGVGRTIFSPSCPEHGVKRLSMITCETQSLTDTDYTALDDQVSIWMKFLGKDINVTRELKYKSHPPQHYLDAFVSFVKDQPDLEGSFRVIEQLSASGSIDTATISQLVAPDETPTQMRRAAFFKQFYSPSFYISIFYAIAGLLFTISELPLGLTSSALQNIYLTGSCLYFFGSVGILYRAWTDVGNEWDQLQHSRMVLHNMSNTDDLMIES